ncbi:MAG: hypothetical protein B7X86_14310 [Sphingobacteriales bacterium 17-39-43]|uniref:uracil-DNA glycosylase n=1 Tax=Daejeonella sp. TaxID=2805397 RepID=UPI000BD7700B|nr:uracil-DNA glycosylase [Daejeonella sp.]OYZ30121.1 MAG: hypothetical protein B7Y24_14075 [Sphingobacteriales bacterium 16-39-50]OZA22839.1 MAG: hypothetical protein B7X86_14310 [Sphingobacteriales bacterium 17-39-43]HQT24009.1 uracil-DNA glycosylase [Daejeonella sp.]HQT58673.1 uracil-DNA glycosylase [Daejeonella sp.]
MNIKEFVEYLSRIETSENAENLYEGNSFESIVRRQNLYIYLTFMQNLPTSVLLVGEAPGHRGCKLTGIPFTSEKILIEENCFGILGEDKSYVHINPSNKLQTEVSAAIVWNELRKYKEIPLMWNIYPFHPFQSFKENTNRSPSGTEINRGKEILNELLKLFDIKKIGAIGKKAESGITKLKHSFKTQYIRHPSYGGQALFQQGISEFIGPRITK